MDIQDAKFYYDFQSINKIKESAGKDELEALKKVSKEFESVFTNMLLKSMREATKVFEEDGLFNSDAISMYQDIADNQLSSSLSQGSGLGLSDMIVKQFESKISKTDKGSDQ